MSELPVRADSSASLAMPATSGWSYAARALVHPSGAAVLIVGVWVGAWIGGIAGTALGILASTAAIVWAARCQAVRRLLDAHLAERERRHRILERERRLRGAGPLRRAEFAELSALVDEIEAQHAPQVERYELQELLDSYIEFAVRHQRLVEGVQRATRMPLAEPPLRGGAEQTTTTRHRKDILSRRVEHRDQCRVQAARLGDELDAIAEFIHLVSELTTCPLAEPGAEQELERRMWELDVQESALRQVTAA